MRSKRPDPKPIVSAVLDDGTIVETTYEPSRRETALVTWHGGGLERRATVNIPGVGHVVPYSASNNLLAHGVVLLPSQATPYESTADLLVSVRAFIHRYADLSEDFEEVVSYYVLLTWIFDAFGALPYMRLLGDWGSGKSRCLQTIGSVCYKPIFTSGASTVSPLFRIIDSFRGTLILDESDFRFSDEKAEIAKILNSGSAAGFPVLRSEVTPNKEFNPTAFEVFGPKIIATRRLFDDRALESRCITEVMSGLPPRADIPLNLPKSFYAEASALRDKLLMYRFLNLRLERPLNGARDPEVEPRVAQVFAPLLSVAEDPRARERIRSIARAKSADLTAERSGSTEAQLLDIILMMRGEGRALGIKEIATRFVEQYGSDYDRPITPRWIGSQLRNRLSLIPYKSHGTFLVPDPGEAKCRALRERYGLDASPGVSATLPMRHPEDDDARGAEGDSTSPSPPAV